MPPLPKVDLLMSAAHVLMAVAYLAAAIINTRGS